MILKSTVDRIMEATDIVEVIGEFVALKKRGANYVGLSPFANERTPSLLPCFFANWPIWTSAKLPSMASLRNF